MPALFEWDKLDNREASPSALATINTYYKKIEEVRCEVRGLLESLNNTIVHQMEEILPRLSAEEAESLREECMKQKETLNQSLVAILSE